MADEEEMTEHKNPINPVLRKAALISSEKTLYSLKIFLKYRQRGFGTPETSKMELFVIIVTYCHKDFHH